MKPEPHRTASTTGSTMTHGPARGRGVPAENDGFSLVEVLVTLVILSFGLLGMASLQSHALKNNNGAYYASQATILAQDIADRMRANRVAALNGQYDVGFGDHLLAPVAEPDASLAERDIAAWLAHLRQSLPGRVDQDDLGAFIRSDGEVITIAIRWREIHADITRYYSVGDDQFRTFAVTIRP